MLSEDDLTGLPTRGAFFQHLVTAIAHAHEQGQSLCLLVIDVDYLKSVNDHYGHQAGDAALEGMASILRTALREGDLPGRYGGDEFTALLPAASLAEGLNVAERLRLAVAGAVIPCPGTSVTLRLTLSIGVAAYPQDGTDGTALFAAADRGAYAAKDAGRNAIRHTPESGAGRTVTPPISTRPIRLVGRHAELALLQRLLDGGQGAFVLLEGEPGIGKTRLLDELATLAALRGVPTLRARRLPSGHAEPFRPWLEALSPLIEEAPLDLLLRAAGLEVGLLATALPALQRRLTESSSPVSAADPDGGSLGEALVGFIAALTKENLGSTLLFLLDDMQWADQASVDVLARLIECRPALSLLVVAAVCPEESPLPGGLFAGLLLQKTAAPSTGRGLPCERVLPAPLTNREAATLCRHAMGGSESAGPLQQRLIEETAGNPLLLLETAHLIAEQGSAARSPLPYDRIGVLPLSLCARENLHRRLAYLGPEERTLLSLIGLLETHATLPVLCAATDLSGGDAQALLDRMEERRLVSAPRGREGYRLVYPQMWSVLAEVGAPTWSNLRRWAVQALVTVGVTGTVPPDSTWSGRRVKLEAYLLGGRTLRYDERPLPDSAYGQRALIALLALLVTPRHCLPRMALCAILWPDEPERHAAQLGGVLRALPALLGSGPKDPPPMQRLGDRVALHPALDLVLDIDIFTAAADAALAQGDTGALRAAASRMGGLLLPELVDAAWVVGRRAALTDLQRRVLERLPNLPNSPPTNLPAPLTNLIGREREQAAVPALLGRPGCRLITLTGPGGVGKTRLALQVAQRLLPLTADGAWLVELAGAPRQTPEQDDPDPAELARRVAHALGLHEPPGRTLLQTLADRLKQQDLLLVLDNCEHVVAAAAVLVDTLLRACPRLRILATSREPLDIEGEVVYAVSPLPTPMPAETSSAGDVLAYDAVRLFVERARARRPDFTLDAARTKAVVEICARLDGMPLVIELAAACIGTMPVTRIAAELDACLSLLVRGPRTASPRQQTLRGALDWSYDLLSPPEQALLRGLSVFAGGWMADAAEVVCAEEADGQPASTAWFGPKEVGALLDSLVRRSLVQIDETVIPGYPDTARYRLLNPLQQYGQERLTRAGETAALRNRHLRWCVALADQADRMLNGPEQTTWLDRLETEHDNLRAALSWSMRQGASWEQGLRLAGTLANFWNLRGYFTEGLHWLEQLLAGPAGGMSEPIPEEVAEQPTNNWLAAHALALKGAGYLCYEMSAIRQGIAYYEKSLALYERLGDTQAVAQALWGLGALAHDHDDLSHAISLHERCLALQRPLGPSAPLALTLHSLGITMQAKGDLGQAETYLDESWAIYKSLGDMHGVSTALANKGLLAQQQGQYERANALYTESMALNEAVGYKVGIALQFTMFAYLAQQQGDRARARWCFSESLRRFRDLGTRWYAIYNLLGLAWVAVTLGQATHATILLGAVQAQLEALEMAIRPVERPLHEWGVAWVREALGEEEFARTWAIGRALDLEAAIALALAPE